MNCLVQLAALCLFDPANVFMTASYERTLNADNRHYVGEWRFDEASAEYVGVWQLDRFAVARDYGRLEIGWMVPLSSSITLSLGLTHTSLVSEGRDRGQESAHIGFSWRPFE